jgi:hypothetical protein
VPHYRVAWQTSIALWLLVIIEIAALRYVEMKYIRPRNLRITQQMEADRQFDGADNARLEDEGHDKKDEAMDHVRDVRAA